jgi:hypothetical protein
MEGGSSPGGHLLYLSAFWHCVKMPEVNEGGKVYFGSWFQRFHSMASWLCCFWVCGKAACQSRVRVVEPISLPHGSLEVKTE